MDTDIGRRIHAAQAYGGFKSIPALAAKINRPGFGEATIRRIVAGGRQLEDHERQWLEEATGVPAEFFQDGFASAGRDEVTAADNASRLDQVTEQLEELRAVLHESTDKVLVARVEIQTRVLQRLEQIDGRIDEIDRKLDQLTQRDTHVEDAVARLRAAAETIVGEHPTPPTTKPRRRRSSPRGKTRPEADPGQDAGPR